MEIFDLGLHHNLVRACKVDNIKAKKQDSVSSEDKISKMMQIKGAADFDFSANISNSP